jgi:hypothetical protein
MKNLPFSNPWQSKDLTGAGKQNRPVNPMSQNLNMLRQKYCRPASFTGKRTDHLFPLEEECEQGKALLAKGPKTLLHLEEFDPYGLQQTYRDEASGAELPVFAVFDLAGSHRLTFEITTDSLPTTGQPKSLPEHVPLHRTQAFVRKINDRRMNSERALTRLSVILGFFLALSFLLSHTTAIVGTAVPYVLVEGWALGTLLAYILSLFVLNQFCPWKKLVITAEFNGLLPKEAREKARAGKDHFDNVYLIVDQQYRWKSVLLPDPAPRVLDPLMIGELKQGRGRKFYLIYQFDLTEAEQYLADEFATKPNGLFAYPPTAEI